MDEDRLAAQEGPRGGFENGPNTYSGQDLCPRSAFRLRLLTWWARRGARAAESDSLLRILVEAVLGCR
jgi:hypothetical protein